MKVSGDVAVIAALITQLSSRETVFNALPKHMVSLTPAEREFILKYFDSVFNQQQLSRDEKQVIDDTIEVIRLRKSIEYFARKERSPSQKRDFFEAAISGFPEILQNQLKASLKESSLSL